MMSQYENKSDIYLESSELLSEKGLYPAVPHCAYYSCLLLIEHIWYHTLGRTDNDLVNTNIYGHRGTHEIMTNEVEKYIKNSNRKDASVCFKELMTKMGQLKKLRVIADYRDENIDSKKSDNAIKLSNEILPILKKYR